MALVMMTDSTINIRVCIIITIIIIIIVIIKPVSSRLISLSPYTVFAMICPKCLKHVTKDRELERGSMPNVMAALPNIGGALC